MVRGRVTFSFHHLIIVSVGGAKIGRGAFVLDQGRSAFFQALKGEGHFCSCLIDIHFNQCHKMVAAFTKNN